MDMHIPLILAYFGEPVWLIFPIFYFWIVPVPFLFLSVCLFLFLSFVPKGRLASRSSCWFLFLVSVCQAFGWYIFGVSYPLLVEQRAVTLTAIYATPALLFVCALIAYFGARGESAKE
jgi:hypothetical protein